MADTKYTMIGMSGAGKTCYITAMYMKMSSGFDGFTLVTDDKTRAKLERDILTLREPKGPERFPTATNETSTRSYEFKLNFNKQKIISFEILDYAGGLLRTRENTYSQVKDSIAESTALFILIDGKSFCTEAAEDRKENVFFDCAMSVTPIIQDFADANKGNLPPIVFVVTKADICKEYVKDDEITKIIKDLFSPAFSEGTYSYICAVSLGDSISDDNYKGRFRPIGVHIPFFIGSYHEYFNRCIALKNEVEKGNANISEEKRTVDSAYNKEMKKWEIFRNKNFMQDCLNRAREAEKAISDNNAILDNTKKYFYKFGQRLEDESQAFKCFIDGVEQSRFKSFNL